MPENKQQEYASCFCGGVGEVKSVKGWVVIGCTICTKAVAAYKSFERAAENWEMIAGLHDPDRARQNRTSGNDVSLHHYVDGLDAVIDRKALRAGRSYYRTTPDLIAGSKLYAVETILVYGFKDADGNFTFESDNAAYAVCGITNRYRVYNGVYEYPTNPHEIELVSMSDHNVDPSPTSSYRIFLHFQSALVHARSPDLHVPRAVAEPSEL